MAHHPLGPLPVVVLNHCLILDEVAEGIADGPGAADEFADAGRPAESFQAERMKLSQGLIVPADRSPHRVVVLVDPAGGVVRGRDAGGEPVADAVLLANPGGNIARPARA